MWRLGAAAALLCGCDARSQADAPPVADTTAAHAEAGPGVKACDLLTREELERVTAASLRTGRTTNDYMGVSQCTWDAAEPGAGVVVSLHERGRFENYRRVAGSTAVGGVGDEAVWNPETRQIAFRADSSVVSVSFLFEPVQRAWAEQLARLALARLTEGGGG